MPGDFSSFNQRLADKNKVRTLSPITAAEDLFGFLDNTVFSYKPRVNYLGDILTSDNFFTFLTDVKNGDRLSFVYEPGKGSTFTNNAGKLIIANKEFADLYLQVYIGPKPPTLTLKRGLLGLK